MMANKSEKTLGAARFTKGQLAGSAEFCPLRDLVNALLDDNETYTKEEADGLLRNFLKRKVK